MKKKQRKKNMQIKTPCQCFSPKDTPPPSISFGLMLVQFAVLRLLVFCFLLNLN